MGRASSFLRWLRSFLPLPAWWIIQKRLEPGGRSLLDIGCGRGGPIELIYRKRKLFSVGADVFWPYLLHCQATGLYDDRIGLEGRGSSQQFGQLANLIDLKDLSPRGLG